MDQEIAENIVALDSRAGAEKTASGRWPAIKALLWCEWFAHSRLILFFIAAWLLCVWLVPLFVPSGWILLLGGFFAIVAGPAFGGSDVIEGCEEFVFSLPSTRSEKYLVRVFLGGTTVLVFTVLNVIALGIDLPQVLTKFYIETGMIESRPVLETGLLFGLVFVFPFALFAAAFVASMLTHSRTIVLSSWFWGAIATLLILQLGCWYENFVWERMNGFFSIPLLVAGSVIVLVVGYRCYRRKEVGPYTTPLTIPTRWWLWLAGFILGLIAALSLISSLIKHYQNAVE